MKDSLSQLDMPFVNNQKVDCLPIGNTGFAEDSAVWDAFRKGDESAFIHIYKTYGNVLYNFGCQFTHDFDLVKDCLQDFFIYLRKNREGLGATDSIKLYLLKSFKRRVIEGLRKTEREKQKNEMFASTGFQVEISVEATFIKSQFDTEQLVKLNEGLKSLDAKERQSIYYFYYEGLGYGEIAEIFGFSHVSSARRLLYRGLGKLRKILLGLLIFFWIMQEPI